MVDKVKFTEYMQMLALAIINRELTKEELKAYYFVLSNRLTLEELKDAVMILLNEWKYSYIPKPQQIIESLEKKENEVDLWIEEVWNILLNHAIVAGKKKNIKPNNKMVQEALDAIGGWYTFADYTQFNWTYEDLKRRKEMEYKFKKALKDVYYKTKREKLLEEIAPALSQKTQEKLLPKMKKLLSNTLKRIAG